MTFKTQKSPEGRVWSLRMRLRGRTTFPFAFVDTYDHNDVCENLYCHRDSFQKIFAALQSLTSRFTKTQIGLFPTPNGYQNQKIVSQMRFKA